MALERPDLERRYRRLLRAFPRGYREHRGEEMLATLLETAGPGQRRPSTRDTAELLQGALRERLGMHSAADLQAGLRMAAPVSLAVACAASIHTWTDNPAVPVLAVVAGAWLAATLALVLLPRLLAAMIAVAWLTTLGASLLATSAYDGVIGVANNGELVLPQVVPYAYGAEVLCGLIALVAVLTVPWRPPAFERIGVAVAVVGATTVTILASNGSDEAAMPGIVLRDPSWMGVARLLPWALVVAGVAVFVWRRSTVLLWAGLLLHLSSPVMRPWSGPIIDPPGAWWWQPDRIAQLLAQGPLALVPADIGFFGTVEWGVYGSTLLGAIIVMAVYLADINRRSARPRDGRSALAALSGLALGGAAGLCAYFLAEAGYHGDLASGDVVAAGAPVVAALLVAWVPQWLRRPLILAALAGVVAVGYSVGLPRGLGPEFLLSLMLLLLVAAADVRAHRRLIGAGAAVAVVLGLWLQWLDQDGLWPHDSFRWQVATAPLVGVVLVFALWWAPVVIVRASHGWGGACFAFVAGLLWLALQLRQATDAGVLAGALTSLVIVVFAARIVVRRGRRRIRDAA